MVGRFIRKYWFLFGILAAGLLGLAFPEVGIALNPGSLTTNGIVVVLFVITGLSLPTDTIWQGIRDVRLHLYLQLFIFVLIPAYFLATMALTRGILPATFNVGIVALACLPTTVSSCVVFTQLSEGNAAGAMFSSTLANIMGVVVSPLLLSFLLRDVHYALPPAEIRRILLNLASTILVPFALGQAARVLFAGGFADRHRRSLGVSGNSLILAVIFFAFARSARGGLLGHTALGLILPFAYLAVSHLLLLLLSYLGARLIGLSRENQIAALYVAPQKTVAMGVPLLSAYFAADPGILAVAMLPLMLYHPFQLLVAGLLRSSALMRRIREGGRAAAHPERGGPAGGP